MEQPWELKDNRIWQTREHRDIATEAQKELFRYWKKNFLKAMWKSVKTGAGDCAMPSDYLVFMVKDVDWQEMSQWVESL